MEIQSANQLQDTIHNLYTQSKMHQERLASAAKPEPVDKLIQTGELLVSYFNDYELCAPGGRLSATEYQQFLLAQMIVFDTINAKFLWKRIPKGLKEEANNLKELWNIGTVLIEK